jgi:hypothetical protein
MTPPIEPKSHAASVAVLDRSDPAIEIAGAVANGYTVKQLVKQFDDHQRRMAAKSNAEFDAFDRASDWIRRQKRGWSAISDRELAATSYDERERARKARNKRDERAKKAKPVTPAPATAALTITREEFYDRVTRLQVWLALPGPRQRHLSGRKTDIMCSWVVYQDHVAEHHRGPSLSQFADAFSARFDQPMTRPMAQNRLKLLGTLMAAGGPLR